MEQVRVERLDHVGVIVTVMNDVGLIDMIDTRLVPDTQAMMTPGEAVAGMLLNGVGFAHRPLSWTPHRPSGLQPAEVQQVVHQRHHARGRTLDAA